MHAKRIEEPKVKLEITMTEKEFEILNDIDNFFAVSAYERNEEIVFRNVNLCIEPNYQETCEVLERLFLAFNQCER